MGAMINRTHTDTRVHTLTKHPFNKRTAHIKFLMDGDMGRVDVHRARNVEQIPISSKTDIDLSLSLFLCKRYHTNSKRCNHRCRSLLFRSTLAQTIWIEKRNKANNTMPTMIRILLFRFEFQCTFQNLAAIRY